MLKTYCLRKIQSLEKIQTSKAVYKHFYNLQSAVSKKYKLRIKTSFPMHREWKPKLITLNNNCDNAVQNYKLLSYNILAQDLLVEHLHLYYDIDHTILRWESRLNKIKAEICDIDPDILCLQEMQYDHLQELVNQIRITSRKMEYVFKKKTGTRSDGCVIIYDKNKFKVVSEQYVEYYTVGVPTLNRENIGMMVKLQPVDDSTAAFVVATTHLLYNPKREDVRISQITKLMHSIVDFSSAFRKNSLPVILTGDFNFTSDTDSFKILTTLHNSKTPNALTTEGMFQLKAIDFGKDNAASTYQGRWITVDYILKSRTQNSKSIQINSIYQLPSVEQCWKNGKIPNKFIGSDHYSLAIKFTII